MKILIVSQYYFPDPFRVQDVAEGLIQKGHQVTVLTGRPNYIVSSQHVEGLPSVKDNETVNGVEIIRVKTFCRGTSLKSIAFSYCSYALNASFRVFRLKKDYDIVLVYQLSPILMVIPGLVYSHIAHKKMAIYCLDLWPESMLGMGITHKNILYKIMAVFSRYAYRQADVIGYTSKMFKKYFEEIMEIRPQKLLYIPQFAEDLYQNITRVSHEGINIVFTGNIGESQDIENVIRAAALVKNKSIRWHIIGDGRNLESCQRLVRDLHLTEKVYFYGRRPVTEMPKYYAFADVMLVTLEDNKVISYTLPGKVQSYMAAGKAILGAASGEIPLILNDAKCGRCCKPGCPQALADLADLIATEDRSQYEVNSKEYYINNFTKEKHISSIEEMLLGMIN